VPNRSPKLPGRIDLWTPLVEAAEGRHGVKPQFAISAASWRRMEAAYKRQLSNKARADVLTATRWFIFWEESERKAVPVVDVRKRIAGYKRRTANLLEAMLADGAEAEWAQDLVSQTFCPAGGSESMGRHTFHWLCQALAAFGNSCEAALGDLKAQGSWESQWGRWIRHLARIMEENDIRVRIRKDVDKTDKQSPFVIFVRELQKCLPVECKRRTHSDPALAEALSVALKNRGSKTSGTA
jgi:hypothetical protein